MITLFFAHDPGQVLAIGDRIRILSLRSFLTDADCKGRLLYQHLVARLLKPANELLLGGLTFPFVEVVASQYFVFLLLTTPCS